jgi:hypothetical protein
MSVLVCPPVSSLVHYINGGAMLHMSQYYHCSKDNENQLGTNEGHLAIFLSAASITSEVK